MIKILLKIWNWIKSLFGINPIQSVGIDVSPEKMTELKSFLETGNYKNLETKPAKKFKYKILNRRKHTLKRLRVKGIKVNKIAIA